MNKTQSFHEEDLDLTWKLIDLINTLGSTLQFA
jgi:hypothetical protein